MSPKSYVSALVVLVAFECRKHLHCVCKAETFKHLWLKCPTLLDVCRWKYVYSFFFFFSSCTHVSHGQICGHSKWGREPRLRRLCHRTKVLSLSLSLSIMHVALERFVALTLHQGQTVRESVVVFCVCVQVWAGRERFCCINLCH